MMDIVTKSWFDKFRNNFELMSIEESSAFELFSIYSVVSKYVDSNVLSKDILMEIQVGNGGDWGLDGIAVVVNGKIVSSLQEVQDLHSANGYLEVKIILVQAKVSSEFDVGELSKTMDGAKYLMDDILEENVVPECNEDVENYRHIIKFLYSKASDFKDQISPYFHIYYITCGTYNGQRDFVVKVNNTKQTLLATNLLSSVDIDLYGKTEVINCYKAAQCGNEADLIVEQKLNLPETENIKEGYLFLLPFSQYRKLIEDKDGKIKNSVFYDNVRDYQGENSVNKAITNSLKMGDIALFTSMNNGVTIVTKAMQSVGKKIHLVDYQIVNGCQTSNVLFQNRSVDNIDNLLVTVKLICSTDKEVRDKIIVGTNSQTEVRREQLVSLMDSLKNIEDYYNAQNRYEKLYFERRSKQYKNTESKVPDAKIITIPFQIKSFVAMILGEPERVGGYYGQIVDQFDNNGRKVFSEKYDPALYYTSALASHKMTELMAIDFIPRKYKKVKFMLLYAFRLISEKEELPPLSSSSKKTQAYCDSLCDILNNQELCKTYFQNAMLLVDLALKRDPVDADRNSVELTRKIIGIARQNKIRS